MKSKAKEKTEPGAGQPKLSDKEREDVERKSAPRTEVVYETIRGSASLAASRAACASRD